MLLANDFDEADQGVLAQLHRQIKLASTCSLVCWLEASTAVQSEVPLDICGSARSQLSFTTS